MVQTFNFQKNSFSIKSSITFTGNIGFIEPTTYLKLHQANSLPKFPKVTDSLVQFRLGLLTNGYDYWYALDHSLKIEVVKKKLISDLRKLELLFESHKTILSIEEFFKDRVNVYPYWGELGQFALYKKIGKDELAARILQKDYDEARKPKSWVTISERKNGIWEEKKSEPEINKYWVERTELVAKIYGVELKKNALSNLWCDGRALLKRLLNS